MNIIKARVVIHNYKSIDIWKAWVKKDLTPLEIKAMEFRYEYTRLL